MVDPLAARHELTPPALLRRARGWWPGLVILLAALLGILLWRPTIEVPVASEKIRQETGLAYLVVPPRRFWPVYRLLGDTNEDPARSNLVVLRDGRPLGPAHAVHAAIRNDGGGAFSHWAESVYFSTPDNADPRSDGHRYALRAKLTLDGRLWWSLAAIVVAVTLLLGWALVGRIPAMLAWTTLRLTAGRDGFSRRVTRHARLLRQTIGAMLIVLAVAVVCLLLWRPSVEAPLAPHQIVPVWGYTYSARVPDVEPFGYRLLGDTSEQPKRSTLVVLRDGRPMGPAHTLHDVIRRDGRGAFSHWNDLLYFSTPDNTDPRADGHVYLVRGRAAPGPFMSATLAVVLTATAAILLRLSGVWPSGRRARARPAPETAAATGVGMLSFPLKVLALIVVCAPWAWVPVMIREASVLLAAGRWALLAAYVAAVAVSVAGVAVVPFLRNGRVRAVLTVALLLGVALDQMILGVSGRHLNLDMMITLWRERGEAAGAIVAYRGTIMARGAFALLLGAVFLLRPAARLAVPSRFMIIPLGALAAAIGIINGTDGKTEAFPPPYAAPAQLALASRAPAVGPVERLPIEYSRPLHPRFRKIVFVVDESVRGDYLGINNPRYDNTPTLRNAGSLLANYGTATSATNCSAGTRLILRMGLGRHQLPDTRGAWRRQPTIWQYAHKAGYRTVQIDAFDADLHSYMDRQEARTIDVMLSSNRGKEHLRDPLTADLLLEVLKRDEPAFIYVNKLGTHAPYHYYSAPDMTYDPSPLVASLPLDRARRDEVRDYHKALRWQVDGFFEKVLPEMRRTDAILIYTSDHGQSLYEGGYDITHCSMTPGLHRGEVRVPLFVVTTSPAFAERFRTEAQRGYDRATHFEIFPTLLELMGYSPDWVEQVYGPSLLNVPGARTREFLMGTFDHPAAVWLGAD